MKFDDSDPAKYEALSLELTKRFPESPRAAQALYWLAFRLKDPAKKMKYAEMMSNEFPRKNMTGANTGWTTTMNCFSRQTLTKRCKSQKE